jgi:SPP1 gp7 family putative phage head morphogenesis protein
MTAFDAQRFDPRGPRINPLAVDVPDIIRWIEDKRPRQIGDWNELGAQEYARAFTAARTMGSDIIRDLYEGLVETIREGGTETDFAERMMPILRRKGWLPELDDEALGRRVRLIYDTNLRTSQAVGKWRAFQRTKQLMPYLRYSAVMDRRTRPSHAALHGIVLPVDHPFWAAAFPPCGFGCRCVVTSLSRSQAARSGVSDDARADRALSTARALSRGPGDFWGYNVGQLADQAAVAQVQRVNERRLPGSTPVTGTFDEGRAIWSALYSTLIMKVVETLRGAD